MENPFQITKKYSLNPISSVLQIGASGGQEVSLFKSNGVIHAVMIEPLDYPFSILCKNINGLDNYLPVQSAVGAIDGERVDFFVANNDGQSSSTLKPAHHLLSFPEVKFNEKISINSFTLDTIARAAKINNKNLPDQYDLIYVDVQGAELEVFKGANKCLSSSKYIFTEVGYGGGYENDVSYLNLTQYLDAFGYKLVSLNINPVNGYGDAFFMQMKPQRRGG